MGSPTKKFTARARMLTEARGNRQPLTTGTSNQPRINVHTPNVTQNITHVTNIDKVEVNSPKESSTFKDVVTGIGSNIVSKFLGF